MRLGWVTDIHLEFADEPALARFFDSIRRSRVEALLVGGDISNALGLARSLELLAEHLPISIYFVLGNHDYYRGSVAGTRSIASDTANRLKTVFWLGQMGPVLLTPQAALVGHGGWGDGRLGDFWGTPVVLNDFLLISDLAGLSKPKLRKRLEELADEAAAFLRPRLAQALDGAQAVIVLTHVPPFLEACWYQGRYSDANWLPFFSCKAIGDLLLEVAAAHPKQQITVLCGHTHSSGEAQLLPNLTVFTGAADYGHPALERVIDV